MRAFCILGMGAAAFVISSGPVKKVSTFKVKGLLVYAVSQRFPSLFQKTSEVGREVWTEDHTR